jgi:hypothetical protein
MCHFFDHSDNFHFPIKPPVNNPNSELRIAPIRAPGAIGPVDLCLAGGAGYSKLESEPFEITFWTARSRI